MSMPLIIGRKGRLKASKREFEIVQMGPGLCTTIRFRGERAMHEIKDSDLRELADEILQWSQSWSMLKRILPVLLFTNMLFVREAFAVCTQHGTVGPTSTAIVGSNDIAGIEGRHYFLIQNTGTSNPMNVAIGSSNNATPSDFYLGPGASWVMTMQGLKMVPGGDVAAVSASGTTYSFCDW
jgi:hypothetical protein